MTRKKCREIRKNYFLTFKQKVPRTECYKNLKIKMSEQFKEANCWKEKNSSNNVLN